MALPLTWHVANIAGWVAQNVTAIFENIGVVQDGMRSIAVPRQMPDRPDAVPLRVDRGAVRFDTMCASATAPRAACCTASTSRSRPASASGWSARPAPASRPWSICCCAFTRSRAAIS